MNHCVTIDDTTSVNEQNNNVVAGNKDAVNDDDILGQLGDADGATKRVHFHTPIKSRWILTFIKDEIGDRPDMSNSEMKNLIGDCIKTKFITPTLLQKSRSFAKVKIFGNPSEKVLVSKDGHNMLVSTKEHLEMMRLLEHIILSNQ